MAFEHYIYSGTERLRCGFTTGSCAALATQAATRALLSGNAAQASARIVTPSGIPVEADVESCTIEDGTATAAAQLENREFHGVLTRTDVSPGAWDLRPSPIKASSCKRTFSDMLNAV